MKNQTPLSAHDKARAFLDVAHMFRLGALPTEQRHPDTRDLADLSRSDVPRALAILKGIDLGVIRDVIAQEQNLARLESAIRDTLSSGHRVFFYGCGATGRLSMSIEYIWRFIHQGDPAADRVFAFMSGGDLALVHSIENFEDHPEYGARQVREVGFGENDLLVSCTEGGETPSVIGATEEAVRISSRKPFFLYSNPDHILRDHVERSRAVLDNPAIEKICLYVGPMSLSGSTRLQSSTALMLGAGTALLRAAGHALDMRGLLDFLQQMDFSFLEAFVQAEADLYASGDYVLYETEAYGITILTDTTERAPTFSLRGFENQRNPDRVPSLSYLRFPSAVSSLDAWKKVLLRDPVTIEWDVLKSVAGRERLMGFDFSAEALRQRLDLVSPTRLVQFGIDRHNDKMCFMLGDLYREIDVKGLHPLFEHLFLKMTLNMHSTLVMGKLGRFESNVMTWVKPSNKKLIDRAIRYVEHLLEYRGVSEVSYEEICYHVFEVAEDMPVDHSVVMRTVEKLSTVVTFDKREDVA